MGTWCFLSHPLLLFSGKRMGSRSEPECACARGNQNFSEVKGNSTYISDADLRYHISSTSLGLDRPHRVVGVRCARVIVHVPDF